MPRARSASTALLTRRRPPRRWRFSWSATFTSPSGAAARADLLGLVQSAIEQMDPIDREVLALRHFEELTNSEVAEALGIEQKAASIRYIRALRRLKEILAQVPELTNGAAYMADPEHRTRSIGGAWPQNTWNGCGKGSALDSRIRAQHPELAEEIRDLFPTIAATERLEGTASASSDGRATLGPARLERLGDFRLIREIGRGGMGVVFEAEQESLGRRVAVKVLPRQVLLDEKHLKRFQREARIAANLHHTNIVEVFGVGEQDGFHYYVMQYIDGVGLDALIPELAKIAAAGWRRTVGNDNDAAKTHG